MAAFSYRCLLLSLSLPLVALPSLGQEYLREAMSDWSRLSLPQQQQQLDLCAQLGASEFSDYWYLHSALLPQPQVVERVGELERSLQLNRWLVHRPELAAQELARLLLLYGDYQRLWQLFRGWSAEWRDYGRTGVYVALALQRLDLQDEANALARSGLRRQPEQLDYFRVLAAKGMNGQLYRQLDRALAAAANPDPLLLRSLLENTEDQNWQQALLHLYGRHWSDDAYLALRWTALNPNSLPERLNFVLQNYLVTDFILADNWFRRSTGYLPDWQRRRWLDGRFLLDRDYDGNLDEELLFSQGELRQRKILFYNWQSWQLELNFAAGEELSQLQLSGRKNGVSWQQSVHYARYPMVERLQLQWGETRTVFYYGSARFSLPLSTQPPKDLGDWSQLPLELPTLELSGLEKNSFRIEYYQQTEQGEQLARIVDMAADGQPAKIREDLNFDGQFDQESVPYEVAGQPSWIGFARRRDHDHDQYFETKEIYLQGKPLLYLVDLDKDLVSDYTELPTKGGRSWADE